MSLVTLLGELRSLGVSLTLDNGQLRVAAPKGALTPALQLQLRENKEALLDLLRAGTTDAADQRFQPIIAHDPSLPTPLSIAQHRLWFLEELRPGTAFNNLPIPWKISGTLDVPALEWAIAALGRRHDILRASITVRDSVPVQSIGEVDLSVEHVDLSAIPVDAREQYVLDRFNEEAARPFDLRVAPLMRFRLYRSTPTENWLLYVTNHVVFDGWSHDIVLRELSQLYASRTQGTPVPPPPPVRFTDYVRWHEAWLDEPPQVRQLEESVQRLTGMPFVLDLPTDHARPADLSNRATQHMWKLDPQLLTRLRKVAQANGATLNMLALASIEVLLMRYSGQADFGIGMAVNGRTRPECEELVGMYVNTLVVRSDVAHGGTFRELLARVRETSLQTIANQDVPFDRLVNAMRPPRERNRTPLYQAFFSYQEATKRDYHLGDLALSQIALFSGEGGTDVGFWIRDHTSWAIAGIELLSDLFSKETADRWMRSWQRLLEAIAENPDEEIATIPVIAAEDLAMVRARSVAAAVPVPDALIHTQFAEMVRRHPARVALRFEDTALTFAELDARSNQVAQVLASRGVGPDTIVGVCLPRSLDLVVAMLGVLKAGGAYLPLDPMYPHDRLALYVEDSATPVVVTSAELAAGLGLKSDLLLVDRDAALLASQPTSAVDAAAHTGAQLAYVIYTSGSTGRPKGVMIEHRNVINFFVGMHGAITLDANGVWLAGTSTSFDISVLELWGSLCHGREVVVAGDMRLGEVADARFGLGALAERYAVTHIQCTPSQARLLLLGDDTRALLGQLQQLVIGGEALSPDLAEALVALVSGRVVNAYGPTEVTVWATTAEVRSGERITIGRPMANTSAYIVDEQRQLVPFGSVGELCLGGFNVTRGYLFRDDLTADRFVPNPHGPSGHDRIYRTGDLVRYLADGTIAYLGRNDFQVKVRGYRIELGEIEAALLAIAGVRDAVVTALGAAESKRLVAYVQLDEADLSDAAMRDALRVNLPEYMVPASIVRMDAFPLTPNGKVDRKALPVPSDAENSPGNEFVEPVTATEVALCTIWSEVLGVPRVGRTDDFFALGGHSLMAVRIFDRIRDAYGVRLPLASLFEGATVAQLAARIEANQRSDSAETEPAWTTLVSITKTGTETPFFCAAGAGGNPMNLLHIANAMSPNRPFYGLQFRGVDGVRAPHGSIAEMASEFIADIRTVQPHGPYLIGGYSLGGLVAYEVAQQLQAAGEKVALLVLLDTLSPTLPSWTRTERVLAHVARLLREGPGYLVQRARDRKSRNAAERAWEMRQAELDEFALRNEIVERASYRIASAYQMTPYHGDVLLVKSQIQLGPSDGIGYRTDETNGWREHVRGKLFIKRVKFRHLDIVTRGAAPETATIISHCLDAADGIVTTEAPELVLAN